MEDINSQLQVKFNKQEKKLDYVINFLKTKFGVEFQFDDDDYKQLDTFCGLQTSQKQVTEIKTEVDSDGERSEMSMSDYENGDSFTAAVEPIAGPNDGGNPIRCKQRFASKNYAESDNSNDSKNESSTSKRISTRQTAKTMRTPFACYWKNCRKRFTKKFNLDTHIRTHKPFHCDRGNCGQRFASKNHVRKHIGGHEKPFACGWENCAQRFTLLGSLIRHLRTHIGDKPFACNREGCGQRFVKRFLLIIPKRIHNGKRGYFACHWENCGRRFIRKELLITHIHTHKLDDTRFQKGQKNLSLNLH